MKIVIAGGDSVGLSLIKFFQYNKKEHKLVLIENNPKKCEIVSEEYPDVKIVWGDATHPNVLKASDIENANVFVATVGDDKTNLIAAKAAKSFGVKKIIIKISNEEYVELAEMMGFSNIINPSHAVSAEIVTSLYGVDFVELFEDLHMDIVFNSIKINNLSGAEGSDISEFSKLYGKRVQIVFVIREDKYLLPFEIKKFKELDKVVFVKRERPDSRLFNL